MRIGLRRISSRTMQFECTLHNGRGTSAFYCGIVRSYLGTATSSRQIWDVLSASGRFAPYCLGAGRVYRAKLLEFHRLVWVDTHTPHARTLNEFNIKSAIKLKTFCYVLNKFRPVYFPCTNEITLYCIDETAKIAYQLRFWNNFWIDKKR